MRILIGCVLISATLIIWSNRKMTEALERLIAEVTETRGVAASAVSGLSAIPQMIRDAVTAAVGDATALESTLNGLADELDAAQADLTGALNANPAPSDPGADTLSAGGEGEDEA